MRVKLLATYEAFEAGVPNVILGDGRIASPILAACAGHGTAFTALRPDEGFSL